MTNKNKKQVGRWTNVAIALIVLGCVVYVFSRFVHLGRVEYTNNAQVRQNIVPVNSRIQGFITEVRFKEYQNVNKGDTLVVIEDAEYRLRVAQAEADYHNALAGKSAMSTSINASHNNIIVSDAATAESKIRLDNAEREYKRYEALLEQEAVTRSQFDAVKTTYEAAKARYEQLSRQRTSTALVKDEQVQRLSQNDAAVQLAEAALELAKLNLSYTIITAPADGVTGRKNIYEGQLIQPGQGLLNVVESDDVWITANYKETQTANIAEGNHVDITVDAVPGVKFRGVVQSISEATGASFSLVPQDNATGNFVKVEQRIPVRIAFTADNDPADVARLRSGMNAECKVKY